MSIRPESIAPDIQDEMYDVQERGFLILRDSEAATHFFDQIDKLDAAQTNRAFALRAIAYQLCGDIESALSEIDKVTAQAGLHPDWDRLCVLANLGFATEGLEYYRRACSPESGIFTKTVGAGISVGAFRTIAQNISRAIKMHLSNLDSIPRQSLLDAARILEERGTEDDDVAGVVSVAGELFREYGLVFVGSAQVDTFDVQNVVRLSFRLAITPEQAATLHMEFLDRLDDQEIDMPSGLLVAFQGTAIETYRSEEAHA
ncbi:hypothetical protein BZM27_09435 [Paraburkholderia steynii]|uniref:Tetratricopeptide repeat protein n=1 Tax=Paraburkholderia steynii TaxID=1245441 RepID=A0A4R0XEE6_9BURK|nr:hypothetical protein BZM27_09435 [Paraburkholderia steynii]